MSHPLRLLIVDDSPDDAELLLHALRGGGYEIACEVVDSAAGMRAALEREDWDVITSDHAMPGFSAPAALALAMQIRPNSAFIIVSGEIDLNLAVSLIKEGAQDYVQKRELDRVVPAIQAALREAEMRRERERNKEALKVSEARYRGLFAGARDGILIIDADSGRVIDVNPFLMEISGYPREEFVGRNLSDVGAFADKEAFRTAFKELQDKGYVRCEDFQIRTCDGRLLEVEFVVNVYLVDHTELIQGNIRTLAERKHRDRHFQYVPNYDSLTGLPNRMLFHDRLGQAIKVAEREHHELSLLCLDLDHLRSLHGALGDGAVDKILKVAADTIQQLVRQSDTVGRIGDEQLAVILPRTANPQNAATVARKIIDALFAGLRPGSQKEEAVRLGASIGIAIFPTGAPNADALLKAADSAMYEAKQLGKDFSFGAA
jgi:diguanylate cyclase (GGDEF)-like protein/PAS domain S-box-containing protein